MDVESIYSGDETQPRIERLPVNRKLTIQKLAILMPTATPSAEAACQAAPRFAAFHAWHQQRDRTGDLRKRKISHVKYAKPGQAAQIRESRTVKTNTHYINREVCKAPRKHLETSGGIWWHLGGIWWHLVASGHSDDDYLFQSRRGHQKPLTIMTVNRMITEWCKTINLEGNYGAHSLRKTRIHSEDEIWCGF